MSDPYPTFAPQTMAAIRARRAELDALVGFGKMTREDTAAAFTDFASLSIAHVKEHGPEKDNA